jgi:aminoglycoside phosphotransferase family enzyme
MDKEMATPNTRDAGVTQQEKLRFLLLPASYPEPTRHVEAVETHMSWVFLTDRFAYKLKKPVLLPFLDFSTIERRKHFCSEEIRLNERLAPRVYIGTVPLTADAAGGLSLAGPGSPVDWLVKMHRLPARMMLDQAIQRGTAGGEDLQRLARLLVGFYRGARVVDMNGREYRQRFEADVATNLAELVRAGEVLADGQVESVHRRQRAFLDSSPWLLEQRATARHVVEAHGDLRPEHVFLGADPQIIDCLEFHPRFRIMDPADELAFFGMECEILGSPEIGAAVFERYCRGLDDRPSPLLLDFYRCYRACVKAKLAIWHVRDPEVREPARWPIVARRYLELAEGYAAGLPSPA